jgi:hypothetical protein
MQLLANIYSMTLYTSMKIKTYIKAKGLKFHLFRSSKSFFSLHFTSIHAAVNIYMTYVNLHEHMYNKHP